MSSIVQHNVQTGTSSPLSHAQPCTTLLGMLLPGAGGWQPGNTNFFPPDLSQNNWGVSQLPATPSLAQVININNKEKLLEEQFVDWPGLEGERSQDWGVDDDDDDDCHYGLYTTH